MIAFGHASTKKILRVLLILAGLVVVSGVLLQTEYAARNGIESVYRRFGAAIRFGDYASAHVMVGKELRSRVQPSSLSPDQYKDKFPYPMSFTNLDSELVYIFKWPLSPRATLIATQSAFVVPVLWEDGYVGMEVDVVREGDGWFIAQWPPRFRAR